MRRFRVLGLIVIVALPCWGAKRLTVSQLEQTLSTVSTAHKPDAEIARQISGLELTERLTEVTLDRLNKLFATGPYTSIALQLLADRSAFLDPPSSELPPTPAPDAATQQHLLEAAQRFAIETLPRLPNLLATRTTFNFDDSPQEGPKGGYSERLGLHLVGTSKAEVSVLNEREHSSSVAESASTHMQGGLLTWGEFGSTLLIILSDSSQGKITWSHWEQISSGLLAVFHYQVPKALSHYEIDTPVERTQPNGGSNRWSMNGGTLTMKAGSSTRMVRTKPAYQGSLWVDPASGTILRVSLIADLKGNPAFERGAILVDYGPVHIADKTFICPVRSLALSSAPATVDSIVDRATTEWLNENLFTGYHLFASTSRILSAASAPPPTPNAAEAKTETSSVPQASPQPPIATATSTQPAHETTAPSQLQPPPITPMTPVPAEKTETQPTATVVARAAAPETKSPENVASATPAPSLAAETSTPGSPPSSPVAPASPTSNTAPTFHVEVNAVLVPVVVRDSQGRTVGDLQQQDFQVFDDGKQRRVSRFLVESHLLFEIGQNPAAPLTPPGTAPQPTSLPARVTVFLLDDMHLSYADLKYVRDAASKALDSALTGSDMAAVVTTSGKINSGLTRDRAMLTDAIKAVQPQGIYRSDAAECPKISYYQADLILNQNSVPAFQDAVTQIMTVCDPKAPADLAKRLANTAAERVLNVGTQDVLTTYAVTSEIVRRMANLPGQHLIILVSPGFLPIEEQARAAESRLLNLAAQSNVTISALDARGLYNPSVTAGEDMRNRAPGFVTDLREREMTVEENAMGELAEGTGGDFFHNNNDLDAGFRKLLLAPETIYMLELRPDGTEPDGAYHRLSVKVDRDHVHVQARRGYFAPGAASSKK